MNLVFFFLALNSHIKKKAIGNIINRKFEAPVHDAMVKVVANPNKAPKIIVFQYGSFFLPIFVIEIEKIRTVIKNIVIPMDS